MSPARFLTLVAATSAILLLLASELYGIAHPGLSLVVLLLPLLAAGVFSLLQETSEFPQALMQQVRISRSIRPALETRFAPVRQLSSTCSFYVLPMGIAR